MKCTHLLYGFAGLNGNTITVGEPWIDTDPSNPDGQLYSKVVALKKQNPALKVMISSGGAGTSASVFSTLASSTANINTFVSSVVSFMKKYAFDGFDLDWEQPTSAADKINFVSLLSALRKAFGSTYLLSIAVGISAYDINESIDLNGEEISYNRKHEFHLFKGYNVPSINSYVDFINLMEYDIHGSSWEPSKADHLAPFYQRSWDDDSTANCNGSVSYWISQGATPSKLNMGIPLYGNSWTLTSSTVAPPAPANGPGTAGPYSGQPGFLAYFEICNNIKSNGWVKASDPKGLNGPWAYSSTSKQWVGFDDVAMVTAKTKYAVSKGLGGVMVWEISYDDYQNICGGGKNPLLSAIWANH